MHLIAAFLINALLLVLGGTLFFGHTNALASLQAVFDGLKSTTVVGALASQVMSWLFALALLITGLISINVIDGPTPQSKPVSQLNSPSPPSNRLLMLTT